MNRDRRIATPWIIVGPLLFVGLWATTTEGGREEIVYRARVPLADILRDRHQRVVRPSATIRIGMGTHRLHDGARSPQRIYELVQGPHRLSPQAPPVWDVRIKNGVLGRSHHTSAHYEAGMGPRAITLRELCWVGLSGAGAPIYAAEETMWGTFSIGPSAVTHRVSVNRPGGPYSGTGEILDTYVPMFGRPKYFRPCPTSDLPLSPENFAEFAGLSPESFVVEDNEGHFVRPSTAGERAEIHQLISAAVPKHSRAHVDRRRQSFLEIMGGGIPIVQPTLAGDAYYALPVRVVRGCPRKCSMCTFYREFTVPPLQAVLQQVRALKQFMGRDYPYVRTFSLIDSDALLRPAGDLATVLSCINDEFNLNYADDPQRPQSGFAHFFTHGRTVARRVSVHDLKRLRRAGLGPANLGLETGCQELLDLYRKGLDLTELRVAIDRLRAADIPVTLNVIPELGGKRYQERNRTETMAFLRSLDPPFGTLPGETVYLCELDRTAAHDDFLRRHGLPDQDRTWYPKYAVDGRNVVSERPPEDGLPFYDETTFDEVSRGLKADLSRARIPHDPYQFLGL